MARLLEGHFTADQWRMIRIAVDVMDSANVYTGRTSDFEGVTKEIRGILSAEDDRLAAKRTT